MTSQWEEVSKEEEKITVRRHEGRQVEDKAQAPTKKEAKKEKQKKVVEGWSTEWMNFF